MKARFNEVTSTEKLDEVFDQSKEKPVVIFKHSTTCPISSEVYREVSTADADINLIVVQTSRGVSSAVAERTGIRHESPQAIILKDNQVIYHASHFDVTAEDILRNL